jgi:hypothetical protein
MKYAVSKPEEHAAAPVSTWLWRAVVGSLTLIIAIGLAAAVWLGTRPAVTGTPITTRELTWAFGPGASSDQANGRFILRTDAKQASGMVYATGDLLLGDSVVQVRAARLSGSDDAGYGMIVRYRAPDEYVTLLIGGDGYIAVGQMSGGAWRWRVPWQQWPHIRRGLAENLLRAECHADRCRFFVNDEFAFEVDSLPAAGQIGSAVWKPTQADSVTAEFREWRLWNY